VFFDEYVGEPDRGKGGGEAVRLVGIDSPRPTRFVTFHDEEAAAVVQDTRCFADPNAEVVPVVS
jgi:hypothetical protein